MTWEIIKMALESLFANKTRSFLSMLGIIIGVSTVIAVIAIGEGAQKAVNDQFSGLSAKSIIVMSNMGRGATASSKLTTADATTLKEKGMHIASAVSSISGDAKIAYGSQGSSKSVVGAGEGYFEISKLEFSSGAGFGKDEISSKKKVAVIGSGVVTDLYIADPNIIGKEIAINNKKFEIVGVLKEKGASMGPLRTDDSIIIPSSVAEESILGSGGRIMINAEVDSVENMTVATEELKAILRETHKLKVDQEDDFRVMDAGSMIGAAQNTAAMMSLLLTAIAAITLLVSGIGIMNVMFATVSERTKEIGIAKAIGGKRKDILSQFLLESAVLSAIGGIVGVLIGTGLIYIFNKTTLTQYITLVSSFRGVFIGVGFSVFVGVFFGFYPAFKASKLDPVDALRSE